MHDMILHLGRFRDWHFTAPLRLYVKYNRTQILLELTAATLSTCAAWLTTQDNENHINMCILRSY